MKKTKKILSLLLSAAMICTMFTFTLGVSAASENVVHVSSPSDLSRDVCKTFTEDTIIIVDNDITLEDGFRFSAKTGITVTVQSADAANPSTITSTVWIGTGCNDADYSGKVVIKDLNIDLKEQWNFSVYNGAHLTMENVTVTSKNPSEYITNYCSFTTIGFFTFDSNAPTIMPTFVTMNNCVIDPGNVAAPTDGIDIYTDNVTLKVNNTTIKSGVNPTSVKENFGSGNGINIGDSLKNINVELNNSSISGGYSDDFGGGDGIRAHSGNFVLNNSTVIAGGSKTSNIGIAIAIHNGNVIVNGGNIKSDLSSVSVNNLMKKWNNDSKGTLTINPTINIKDNIITISPAIENVSLTVNGTETLVTDINGQATKSSNFVIGDVITFPETIKLNASLTAFCNSKEYKVSTSATPISATANIPTPSYTVTIPATIKFGEQKQALAKYADKENDQYGNDINVSVPLNISAANVDNLFDDLGKKPQIDIAVSFNGLLNDGGTTTIPYTVKNADSSSFTSGNVFCSFTNSSEVTGEQKATGTVWINRTNITKTADYTGTMIFTISIPNAK